MNLIDVLDTWLKDELPGFQMVEVFHSPSSSEIQVYAHTAERTYIVNASVAEIIEGTGFPKLMEEIHRQNWEATFDKDVDETFGVQ